MTVPSRHPALEGGGRRTVLSLRPAWADIREHQASQGYLESSTPNQPPQKKSLATITKSPALSAPKATHESQGHHL